MSEPRRTEAGADSPKDGISALRDLRSSRRRRGAPPPLHPRSAQEPQDRTEPQTEAPRPTGLDQAAPSRPAVEVPPAPAVEASDPPPTENAAAPTNPPSSPAATVVVQPSPQDIEPGSSLASPPSRVASDAPEAPAAAPASAPAATSAAPSTEIRSPLPVDASGEVLVATSSEVRREIRPEVVREIGQRPAVEVGSDVVTARKSGTVVLPDLRIRTDTAAAMAVQPTTMSLPASIMTRFNRARRDGGSHTGLVLDALRATLQQLPGLVIEARPQVQDSDFFPSRVKSARERREPLRIRPTAWEMAVVDRIVSWIADYVEERQPGSPRVTRSEVVAAALDAYLPARGK